MVLRSVSQGEPGAVRSLLHSSSERRGHSGTLVMAGWDAWGCERVQGGGRRAKDTSGTKSPTWKIWGSSSAGHDTAPTTTTTMLFLTLRVTAGLRRGLTTAAASNEAKQAFLTHSADPTSLGISFLTLNRPQAKNALSMELLADMRAAIEEVRFNGSVPALRQSLISS